MGRLVSRRSSGGNDLEGDDAQPERRLRKVGYLSAEIPLMAHPPSVGSDFGDGVGQPLTILRLC